MCIDFTSRALNQSESVLSDNFFIISNECDSFYYSSSAIPPKILNDIRFISLKNVWIGSSLSVLNSVNEQQRRRFRLSYSAHFTKGRGKYWNASVKMHQTPSLALNAWDSYKTQYIRRLILSALGKREWNLYARGVSISFYVFWHRVFLITTESRTKRMDGIINTFHIKDRSLFFSFAFFLSSYVSSFTMYQFIRTRCSDASFGNLQLFFFSFVSIWTAMLLKFPVLFGVYVWTDAASEYQDETVCRRRRCCCLYFRDVFPYIFPSYRLCVYRLHLSVVTENNHHQTMR